MNEKRTEIASLGEFGLIKHLTEKFPLNHSSSIKGVGDDAAIIKYGNSKSTVVTTDLLLEGIHFDLMYCPLKHLGYKSVVVNVSDIYAMNATPRQITVSIGISNRFSVEGLEEFYEGVKLACKNYNVDLIGGDTTTSQKGFIISITAIGEVDENKLAYRNTAKEGDLLFVTGDLGAAFLGLQILEREKQIFLENPGVQVQLEEDQYLVERQLKPEAQRDTIALFEELEIVPTSMIDISDGLSSELMHICTQSNVGCHIFEEQIPIFTETYDAALKLHMDPITCAMNGGEDYELLFTMNKTDAQKIYGRHGIKCIGEIKKADYGYILESKAGMKHNFSAQGWNPLV
jgi:thiamine-monophosphate kinase